MGRKAEKTAKAARAVAWREPERESVHHRLRREAEEAKRPKPKFTYVPTQPKRCQGHPGGPSGACLACGSARQPLPWCGKLAHDQAQEDAYQASLRNPSPE